MIKEKWSYYRKKLMLWCGGLPSGLGRRVGKFDEV